jgi:hypothetical protein
MNLTSIDNCYEDDGIVSAQLLLASFNRPYPDGTPSNVLVAIIPEYRTDGPLAGKLDRLNFITRPPDGHDQEVDPLLEQLQAAAAAIVADRKRQHDAAIAELSHIENTLK